MSLVLRLTTLTALTLITGLAHAQDGLLWKVTNLAPAQVVPAYAGQGNPFSIAKAAKVEEENVDTALLEEQARRRQQAYEQVESLINSGRALQPDLRGLRIGGILVGNLGPRLLINNDWVGSGQRLQVRQGRTMVAADALKQLAMYDESSAQELNGRLSASLASHPYTVLSVRAITSNSVVLEGTMGRVTLGIPPTR